MASSARQLTDIMPDEERLLQRLSSGPPRTWDASKLATATSEETAPATADRRNTGVVPFTVTPLAGTDEGDLTGYKLLEDLNTDECVDCGSVDYDTFMRLCVNDTQLGSAMYRLARCSRRDRSDPQLDHGSAETTVYNERIHRTYNRTANPRFFDMAAAPDAGMSADNIREMSGRWRRAAVRHKEAQANLERLAREALEGKATTDDLLAAQDEVAKAAIEANTNSNAYNAVAGTNEAPAVPVRPAQATDAGSDPMEFAQRVITKIKEEEQEDASAETARRILARLEGLSEDNRDTMDADELKAEIARVKEIESNGARFVAENAQTELTTATSLRPAASRDPMGTLGEAPAKGGAVPAPF